MKGELAEQLSALVECAKRVRDSSIASISEDYKDVFDRHVFRLRPSVGSFSLVSCAAMTPQLGCSSLRNAADLARKLDSFRSGRLTLKKPGKKTPEKELQSWLLATAMAVGGELRTISAAMGDGCRYWVVSDEIALRNGNDKLVADLLLVRENAEGVSSFVSVELKYARSMRTFEQVDSFRGVLEKPELRPAWQVFAKLMTGGRSFRWDSSLQARGMVIWPALREGRPIASSTIQKMQKYERIDTLGYTCDEKSNFGLRVEARTT